MKKLFAIVLGLFISGSIFSQGINFEHGTFAEALAKAKSENKMVFMDCYTTWCGPCKVLAEKVFPQQAVGDYFNAHFVSIKVDMEKGEGVDLQKQYEVTSYPTLLFMDATGKVIHTMIGGSDAAGLIAEAKIASDPSQRIDALEARYAKGERGVKFVSKYVVALGNAYRNDKMKQVGEEFLANTPCEQLVNVYAFTIIGYSSAMKYGSKVYKYVITNKEKFIAAENIGKENYDAVVGACINNYLSGLVQSASMSELKAAIKACKKDFVLPQQADMERALMSEYYLANEQFDKWFENEKNIADALLDSDRNMALSLHISTAYRVASDPVFKDADLYGKTIEMTEGVLRLDDSFLATYYCLASLYKANGNKEKALENINAFIEKDAAAGDKPDPRVESLKKEIESM